MKKTKAKKGKKKPKIGFIGQGWIGKHYANDFEKRGYDVVRYGVEKEYSDNKDLIAMCDIVFIAVPTPTTPQGFDDHIIRMVVPLVGKGKIAVIKSTILPGTVESIQKENPKILVLHSPEFLTQATAGYDAAHPQRNIVGIPVNSDKYRTAAKLVLSILPKAPYELICKAREAELIKYGGNCWFYFKVIYINMLYDLAQSVDADWKVIRNALAADPRIGETHLDPIHHSGRGAGGNCFIKDFEAFSQFYKKQVDDPFGVEVNKSLVEKNIQLLIDSKKDLDLLKGVYGDSIF
ncbi:MAG: UDP-glucose 6-dehydrogenase, UDPglucose 6-dehydrogenase [Candidatus Paceibacter sp.]|jgi:UDPglucose 6-dehydrogenase|nr:UDP-glucose 6-dehydrogenase, UDPglucose 6-dehydrogenase [Candidatus Paceibacter sp.]